MKSRGSVPTMTSTPAAAAAFSPDHGAAGGENALLNVVATAGAPLKAPSENSATSALSEVLMEAAATAATAAASPKQQSNNNVKGHKRSDSDALMGNSVFYDSIVDEDVTDATRTELTQKAIEQVQIKVDKTKEMIKKEQTSRDANVNEYLKLSSNASSQQQGRIKQVFEKKNQKSAQSIVHYQKKLDDYQKKLNHLQEHGIQLKQTQKLGQGLKSVGNNIRDGISGIVINKPKEFAAQVLLRGQLHHKFGSADNLNSVSSSSNNAEKESAKDDLEERRRKAKKGSASLPRDNSGLSSSTSGFEHHHRHRGKRKCISDDGRRSEISTTSNSESSPTRRLGRSHHNRVEDDDDDDDEEDEDEDDEDEGHHHLPSSAEWSTVMEELNLHREEANQLREALEELRQSFNKDIDALNDQLREERDRYERLEEQVNDLIELHQHEIENIKSGVTDMEEKVQYQSEERLLDIKEHLQSLDTKVNSMEHQQVQQQYLNIEGLDTTDARAVLMKLLTALITFVHVCLFLVGTCMSLARPFVSTSMRAVVTALLVAAFSFLYYRQDNFIVVFFRSKFLSST